MAGTMIGYNKREGSISGALQGGQGKYISAKSEFQNPMIHIIEEAVKPRPCWYFPSSYTFSAVKFMDCSRTTFFNFKDIIYYFQHRFQINYKNILIIMGLFV